MAFETMQKISDHRYRGPNEAIEWHEQLGSGEVLSKADLIDAAREAYWNQQLSNGTAPDTVVDLTANQLKQVEVYIDEMDKNPALAVLAKVHRLQMMAAGFANQSLRTEVA